MAGTLNLEKCLVVVSCCFLVHLHAKVNSVIFSRESWPHSKRIEHLFFNKQVLFQTAPVHGLEQDLWNGVTCAYSHPGRKDKCEAHLSIYFALKESYSYMNGQSIIA